MLPQAPQLENRLAMTDVVPTLLTSDDLHLFNEGRYLRLYEKLGAHRIGGFCRRHRQHTPQLIVKCDTPVA